jgi:Pyruvate/2-oxoacid:ferredoxin oxidoreductase delta subunit
MSFDAFVEGPLLWAAFLVFLAGTLCRAGLWLWTLLRNHKSDDFRWWYLLLPYHKALAKRPLSGSMAYAFHTCMVVVAVFYGGHIVLWEESRFGWSWSPIPDELTDWMTVSLLALAVFFLARRMFSRKSRTNSSLSDYGLILITALPFLTGYLLAHGNLDSVPVIGENMWSLHILSAEIMLIAAAFLFCGVRLNVETCTGCASCELSCPTVALAHTDEGRRRVLRYVFAQCICCAGCVGTCPEEAAELRHEMGISKFSGQFSWNAIRSVELEACLGCGSLFVPALQLDRLNQTIADDYLRYCSRCKKLTFSRIVFQAAARRDRMDS